MRNDYSEKLKQFFSIQNIKSLIREILDHAEPNLGIIGAFTTFGYPVYYLIWTHLFPQPYENLPFRLFCMLITIPCMLYRKIPATLKKYFPVYFYLAFFIDVPLFFNFMMLKNECSIIWVTSLLTGIFMMILILSNWFVISTMVIAGFVLAYVSVLALDGEVSFANFTPEWIPIFLFSIIGSIFANNNRQLAHKTKISFLRSLSGSIAHEMRNPLNAITSALASVQSSLPLKPEKEQKVRSYDISHTGLVSIHNVIEESSNTLNKANKIIDSILTSMQGEEVSTKEFVRLDAGKVLNAAINCFPFNDSQDRKLVNFQNDQDFDFLGDRDLFFYVLFNLLKNSLYYRNKPGFGITIKTESTDMENRIRFRDTGPGIPSCDLERIFESFYTSNKKGGNGLGLSFCRRVIESFGGSITCNSKQGEWTEFVITLEKYSSKKTGEIKQKILGDKRILIVDDHPGNRLIMAHYLIDLGIDSDLAENGKHALELLSEKKYHLVFMDFEMPVMTGDEAAKILRSSHGINTELALHYLQVPIIGITALPKTEASARAKNSGINEVLFKPANKSDIADIIEKYFFSEIQSFQTDTEYSIQGKRILLVDDNETSRKFVGLLLKNYGCLIEQAVNGKEALEFLEKGVFDLVLMDIEMPVMNGLEASKAIRQGECFRKNDSDKKKAIPIIALTGNNDEKSKKNIISSGINCQITKPVFRDELISAISVMLRNNTPEEARPLQKIYSDDHVDADSFRRALEKEPLLDPVIIDNLKKIGGEELLANLFETYMLDTDRLLEELDAALAANDKKMVNNRIHTIKGSSASIGANKMFVLSRHINEFCPENEIETCEEMILLLKAVYSETRLNLQNSIRQFSST